MTELAGVDWATGLSQRIRQLASEGASHEQIDRYVEARRTGNAGLAAQILAEPRTPRTRRQKQASSAEDRALKGIRIAALRPEVNQLKGRFLYEYVMFVLEVSEQIVKTHGCDARWESATVTSAVAEHVRSVAMDRLRNHLT